MGPKLKVLIAAAFAAVLCQSAQAGFVFETSPIEPPKLPPKTELIGTRQDAQAVSGGRNVDPSANLGRVAKYNRQRVDLESKLTSRISQSGDTPAELPVLRGLGRDVTLEDALRQVIPSGWEVYSDQDMPLQTRVSWSGQRIWPMVLHGILVDLDMRAAIDWKNREVMFFVPAPKAEAAQVVAQAPGVEVRPLDGSGSNTEQPLQAASVKVAAQPEPTPVAVVGSQANKAPEAPVPSPVAAPKVEAKVAAQAEPVPQKKVVWVLSPEVMLRENLRRWASASGWTLIWNAVQGGRVIDYTVDARVEFEGEAIGVGGAIAKVISAYYDAEFPLQVVFYRGNKVIEVTLHQVPDTRRADGAVTEADPSLKAAGGVDINVPR